MIRRRGPTPAPRQAARGRRVLILVENMSVPRDRRVWAQSCALARAGYLVTVICPRQTGEPRSEEIEGVRIHRFRQPEARGGAASYLVEYVVSLVASAVLAIRLVVRGGVDVVQACNPPDTYFVLCCGIRLVTGSRFVFDHHDLSPELYEVRFDHPSRVVHSVLSWLERRSLRTADHVIVPNESFRRRAVATRGSKAAISVVRNAPDTAVLSPVPERADLRRGRPHLCCYVGVIGPQDGVEHLVRAIAVLVHERSRQDCHFAILGSGDALPAVRRLADELDVADFITFTGWVDHEMICQYLSTAVIGLAPEPPNPLNDASTMIKTTEYMAFGLPIVAFDVHETRVTAGDAAAYAPADDVAAYAAELDQLLDDPDRRLEMGRLAEQRLGGTLAWSHQEAAYLRAYAQLVGDGPRPHSSTPAPLELAGGRTAH